MYSLGGGCSPLDLLRETGMYDVAVIGLGGVGSQVAFQLAKRGAHVVGFDPFGPPHDREVLMAERD